ncbi:DUF4870 domain-containing protein [uncultured Aquitalea sp.]|uniref:DUF4870 family protein n=1 Tax=uncultured Aquitalea sp. TaxID=540272 RepID=UPI0025CFDE6F|nr:DUF4870 domain-containing protein [uncultured Aquitalea sp.]
MDIITRDDERRLNNLTLIVYILQGIGLFTGVGWIAAVIVNHLKREDTRGTIYESHFLWQLRTFWIGLPVLLIGIVLKLILVGFLVVGVLWVWALYRVIRGVLALNDGKPLPY